MEANECRTKLAHPSPDILHLSESMQSLKLPEELKSVLFSIREEVKSLGEKVMAQENRISKEQHELILEEQREPTPEDPLDPLTSSTECISP